MGGGEEIPPRNEWADERKDTGDNRAGYVAMCQSCVATWILKEVYLSLAIRTQVDWKETIIRSEITRRKFADGVENDVLASANN